MTSDSSTVDVGSSVTLTCTPSVIDASQYNGANINFQYQLIGGSVFRNENDMISEGTVPTDNTELTVNTSSAGTYSCSVTINGLDSPFITGNSKSIEGTADVTAQSKYMCPPASLARL